MTSSTNQPGHGERIAIGGYKPQYLTAIYFTLQAMLKRNLTEIRLADLDAWRADDLLVFTLPQHLDAYQMKNEAGEISFADFVNSAGETGHFIDLAISWQRLRSTFSSHTLQLHFLTTQLPSTSTHGNIFLPKGNPPTFEPSFAAFIREAWQPYQIALHRNVPFSVPTEWTAAFNYWREKSRLAASEFESFAKSVNFIFGFSFPSLQDVEVYASRKDIERLYLYFQTKVEEAKSSNQPIALSIDDLQNLLGRERFQDRNVHYFKVSDWYTPIADSVGELQKAIAEVESGYLALVGSPGSGKSSLLTRTLIDPAREERIVKYYAYVPEEREYSSPPRGEAVNFLQDVTQQLDRYGFQSDITLPELNLDSVRAKFGRQLQLLAEDYQRTQHKTLILLDGLDHIAREQTNLIDRSLAAVLPLPTQLPPGVVIIIGTQHTNDLSESIKTHLRQPNKTIRLRELNFEQVVELLEKLGLLRAIQEAARSSFKDESGELLQRIFHLTQGHPLAFAYLANQLQEAVQQSAPISDAIDRAIPYDGDIYRQYREHWQLIENETQVVLRDVVGMISRMRDAIDFRWLRQTWPERSAIHILESRFQHFFRPDGEGRWHFFHNSFKQFLLARSIETIDGADPVEEQRFHSMLGDRCHIATDYPLVHWETVYHYWKAQRFTEANDVATRDFFEQQILELRPPDEILNDARIATVAAARLYDPIRMFRSLFIWSEVVQRNYELELQDTRLLETLIDLREIAKALRWIMDGQKLRIRDSLSQFEKVQADALKFSARLANAGYSSEGEDLFSIAEPLHYLRAGKPISLDPRPEGFDVLQAWVGAAPFFRKVSDLVETVRKINFEPPRGASDQPNADFTRHAQNRLLKTLAFQLVAQQRWNDVREVAGVLHPKNEQSNQLDWFYLVQELWRALAREGHVEEARDLIREALDVFDLNYLHTRVAELRTKIQTIRAERSENDNQVNNGDEYKYQQNINTIQQLRLDFGIDLYLILADSALAEAWIQDIEWGELVERGGFGASGLDSLENRTFLYSLLVALGKPLPSDSVVVAQDRRLDKERTSLVRITLVLARLRGARWAGKEYSNVEFGELTAAALRAHYAQGIYVRYYLFRDDMTLLIKWLIEEAGAHGDPAGEQVRSELEKIWANPTESQRWHYDLRRHVLLAMLDNNLNSDWAMRQLETLDASAITYTENNSHIEESLTRADICLRLDKRERATFWLSDAIHAAMGVGYVKDYQLSAWIGWLKRRNRLEPQDAASQIQKYANRVVALKNVEGDGAASAAGEFLETTLDWHPSKAVPLFWWLFEKECLYFFGAIALWLDCYITRAEKGVDAELGPAVALLNALYLPWTNEEREDPLITRLIHLLARSGNTNLVREVNRMMQIVLTETAPKFRQVILMNIRKVCHLYGVEIIIPDTVDTEPYLIQKGESITDFVLTLTDGRQLTFDEVVADFVEDYQNLDRFIAMEKIPEQESQRFRWQDAISAAIVRINDAEAISEWADKTQVLNLKNTQLPLAERALELGANEIAQELALTALKGSHLYGWQRNWGEGAKARAYTILMQVNPDDFRKKAFDHFARDIEDVNSHFSISLMIQELESLFPIFATNESEKDVCNLVEEHTTELFKVTPVETNSLEFLFAPEENPESLVASSIRLLISHLRLPIPDLRMRVLRELTTLTFEKPDLMLPFIRDGLKGDEETQDHLLVLCEALANQNNAALEPALDDIRSLFSSDHFGIAERSRRILSLCGEKTPASDPKVLLASTPERAELIQLPSHQGEPSGHLLGHSDAERIKPYGLQAERLARFASVDKETVLRLCAQQLDKWSASPEKLEQDEKVLRSRSTGVRLNYIRPRAAAAFRTVSHVATLLRRQGNLSDQDASKLFNVCMNRFDPDMLMWYPEPQPNGIAPLGIRDYASRDAWIEQLMEIEGGGICQPQDDQGWLILAERLKIESVNYESWEYRQTATLVPLLGTLSNEMIEIADLFERKMGCVVSTYPIEYWRQPDDGVIRLIVQPSAEWFETFGDDWLSLRSDLARHLGWRPIAGNALSWNGSHGDIVLRSFGWQNGIKDHSHSSWEVQSGWRVLISPTGWKELVQELPNAAYRVIEIKRGFAGEYVHRSSNRWIEKLS